MQKHYIHTQQANKQTICLLVKMAKKTSGFFAIWATKNQVLWVCIWVFNIFGTHS